ncbi:MAG: aldehyde dehydrogenase family protein [Planctomycetales bacterium]|nr:aldehyde dehydrogenase family protein [Planctomycetales bacterium]
MTPSSLTVRSPYDQAVVAEIPYQNDAQLQAVAQQSASTWQAWRRVPLSDRISFVRAGLERLRSQAETIARDVTRQMGKPLAQAQGEVNTMLARAEQAITDAPAALADDDLSSPGFVRRIRHEPLGVVLNMAAWNYPLLIPINVIVPALLAGNTVILKHSARTPLTGEAFAAAFGELEIPGLVQHVVMTHAQTETLIAQPEISYVAFTGSVEGGRSVYRAAAQRLLDAGLELGGKDPAYVAADADLQRAIDNLVDGACYNAGQSCCAVERVYVHRSLYDDFVEGCRAKINEYVLGDPLLDSTTMGPLTLRDTLRVMDEQIADAQSRGARVLAGGQRWAAEPAQFYAPTLLADVPNDALAMQAETFGPLLPIAAVESDEDAVAKMNDSRLGLTASIWSTDSERCERLASEINAGTIFRNRCDYIDPQLPWTGWNESGIGSTLSRYGFIHLTRRKAIHFRD